MKFRGAVDVSAITVNGQAISSNINTSSLATTGSNTFNGFQNIVGAVTVSQNMTVNGTVTAGNGLFTIFTDKTVLSLPLTMSAVMSSSQSITASGFLGTASYAVDSNTIDGLHASSFVLNSQTSSMSVLSASQATTASYIKTAQTASYILQATSASFATTSSYALTAQTLLGSVVSASFATTASYALNGGTGNVDTSSLIKNSQTASMTVASSSWAVSASWAPNTGGTVVGGATTSSNNFIGNQIVTGSITASNSILIGGKPDALATLYVSGSSLMNLIEVDNYAGYEVFVIDKDGDITIDSGSFIVSNSANINLMQGYTNQNNYSQINVINVNAGAAASSDIVATNNIGTEVGGFIDMGINSSVFAGSIGSASDAYIYTTGSKLLIGNTTRGTNAQVKFFAGNDATVFPLIVTGSNIIATGSIQGTASYALVSANSVNVTASANNNTSMYMLASDVNNAATLSADIPSWRIPVSSSTSYYIELLGTYQTVATGTGIRLGVYMSGSGTSSIKGYMRGAISNTMAATALEAPITSSISGSISGSSVRTSGVAVANTPHQIYGSMILSCSVSGYLGFYLQSTVSNSQARVNSGSAVIVTQLNGPVGYIPSTQVISTGTNVIDWSLSNNFSQTLTASATYTFANAIDGQCINVSLNNGSGTYTATWPTVTWKNGVTPTLTATASKTDIFTFIKTGATYFGAVAQNF